MSAPTEPTWIDPAWVTRHEAAHLTGLCYRTIQRWEERGWISPKAMRGRQRFYDVNEVWAAELYYRRLRTHHQGVL